MRMAGPKKPIKLKAKSTGGVAISAWSTVSETDVDELKKPKAKGNANLKTIARKDIPKKKSATEKLADVKKVKQTPEELLQVISSKVLKSKNKKKSK